MAQSDTVARDGSRASGQEVLRAQLAVTPHPAANCTVVSEGHDVTEVRHRLKRTGSAKCTEDCECHTEMAYDDQPRRYLTASVEPKCICPVFENHDCIPTIEDIDGESIIVVVTVPGRAALRSLIDGLRRVDASVSVEWLVSGGESTETTEIDVSRITSKQQETLETALEMGYYETPRRTSLSELADTLGISESATSQRLNAAETKLVESYLDE